MTSCVILLQVFLLAAAVLSYQDFIVPNKNWRCNQCRGHNSIFYGLIHRAIHSESLETYLNFDHSWIDYVSDSRAVVNVTFVHQADLGAYNFPNISVPPGATRLSKYEEVFQVVISSTYNQSRGNQRISADAVDDFLRRNPCFIPLHDPVSPDSLAVKLKKRKNIIDGDITRPSEFDRIYDKSAIFIRLPSFHFYSTCQLYEYVTKKQNPTVCPTVTQNSTFQVYWLGNIGWSNCVHPLVRLLSRAMRHGRIFLTPRAMENGAEPVFNVSHKGQEVSVSGPWGAWADHRECPNDTFAWNPWACHFISLSTCNTPELHDAPFDGNIHADIGAPFKNEYLNLLEETWWPARDIYNDAPMISPNEWENARLLAFAQRPNYHLRARLRFALDRLVLLNKQNYNKVGNKTTTTGFATNDPMMHASSPYISRHVAQTMRPCVGLHVRHGDAKNDFRGKNNLDRSLAAHVSCANEFARSIGATNLFLATDNVTMFTLAPQKYPQYGWYAQRRALKKWDGPVPSFEGYWNEKSRSQEVANMLADMIMISRCKGIVGAFDSAFTNLLLQVACNRNQRGFCPPTRDLYQCQPNATRS